MNKNIITMIAIGLLYFISPLQTTAASIKETKAAEAKTAQVLLDRINAIQKINVESLSKTEKENLRTEVKTIRTELTQLSDGVYLSVGALIVIVVLLIILL